jgi:hypothetical protein
VRFERRLVRFHVITAQLDPVGWNNDNRARPLFQQAAFLWNKCVGAHQP